MFEDLGDGKVTPEAVRRDYGVDMTRDRAIDGHKLGLCKMRRLAS